MLAAKAGDVVLCNMSLGFKVGEDEHAAYIAGFAGGCAYDFLYSNSTE